MPNSSSVEDESRTAVVGEKRKSSNNTQRQKKRRKKNSRIDDNFTQATRTVVDQQSMDSLTTSNSSDSRASSMAGAYGKNRLATGFEKPAFNGQESDNTGAMQGILSGPATGQSAESAIPLSDDEEMQDSEGGIVLNVDGHATATQVISLSDDSDAHGGSEDYESGEISDKPITSAITRHNRPDRENAQPAFMIDTTPMTAVKKLLDLDPMQREEQIKYAFYHLARDEIDLSRPVICLKCFEQGHLKEDCQQNIGFPKLKADADRPLKLWISCCICASKSHLVGDCSEKGDLNVKRWSLSELDSNKIVNLNLETGTRKLERDAENRGMRPQGISIKGQAGRHTAGFAPKFGHDSDGYGDSDDELLRFDKRPRLGGDFTRTDRFNPPTQPASHRRGGWYATDSFGRQRSRSPVQEQPSARGRRGSPPRYDSNNHDASSRLGDSYHPGQSRSRHPLPNRPQPHTQTKPIPTAAGKGPASMKLPPPPVPKPAFTMNLPTRKGSNTWASESSAQSGSSTPLNTDQGPTKSRKKKPRKPKHGRGSAAGQKP